MEDTIFIRIADLTPIGYEFNEDKYLTINSELAFSKINPIVIHFTEDNFEIKEKDHPDIYYVELNTLELGIDKENSLYDINMIDYKYFLSKVNAENHIRKEKRRLCKFDNIDKLRKERKTLLIESLNNKLSLYTKQLIIDRIENINTMLNT